MFFFSIFTVLPIRLALEIKSLTLWLRLDVYVNLAGYIADVREYDRTVMGQGEMGTNKTGCSKTKLGRMGWGGLRGNEDRGIGQKMTAHM